MWSLTIDSHKSRTTTWWAHFGCQQYYDKQLRAMEAELFERGEYGELLIMPANGRWYLTRRLKG